MNIPKSPGWELVLALAACAAIFVTDTFLPLGYSVWVLYLLPVLVFRRIRATQLFALPAVGSLLMFLAIFLSPAGAQPVYSYVNRALAVVVLWLVTASEIRRRRIERELMESEDKFRSISESAFDGILIHDGKRIIESNRTLEEMLRLAPGALKGRYIRDLVSPGSLPDIKKHFESGSQEPYEITVVRGDGSSFIAEVRGKGAVYRERPVRGAGILDITERKKREEQLRRSEERFRHLFEYHKAVMLLIEPKTGKIVDANSAAEKFYGYTRERLRSMGIQDINQLPREEVDEQRTKALREQSVHFTFPHRLANGDIRMVDVYSSPVETEGKYLLFSIIHDITERYRAEQELKKTTEQLRLSLQASNQGTWDMDMESGEILWDGASQEIFGIAEKVTTLERAFSVVHPDDRRLIENEISETCAPGRSHYYDVEFRVVRLDGEVRWVSARGNVYFRGEGKGRRAARMVGTNMDVTDRKRAEETIRRERRLLQTIFDNVPVMFTIYDPRIRRIQTNKYLEKVTGWSQEEASRPDFMSWLYPDPGYREMVESYMRSLSTGFRDLIMTARDGRRIETSWANIKLPDGRQVGIGLDIRERKRTEEALRRSEAQLRYTFEQYRLALEAAGLGTVLYYPESRQLVLDARSGNIFGVRERSAGLERIFDLVLKEDLERLKERINRAMAPGEAGSFETEFRISRPDGVLRWVSLSGKVFIEDKAGGRGMRLAGMVMDITRRKESEEILKRDKDIFERQVGERSRELLQAQRELDRRRRLSDIGTLAATVAHELRSPLAFIKLTGSNLKRKVRGTPMEESLENIEEKVNDGGKIIDDLLFYARLKSPRFEPVDAGAILRESVNLSASRFPESGVRIELKGDAVPELSVEGDRLQLKELFDNLINNAVESISPEKKGLVEVGMDRDNGKAVFTVKDNGGGIKAKNLDRIFEPFFSTKPHGTGLGLSVVYQIVQMHNGSINVDSREGQGTVFTIYLPVKQDKIGTDTI